MYGALLWWFIQNPVNRNSFLSRKCLFIYTHPSQTDVTAIAFHWYHITFRLPNNDLYNDMNKHDRKSAQHNTSIPLFNFALQTHIHENARTIAISHCADALISIIFFGPCAILLLCVRVWQSSNFSIYNCLYVIYSIFRYNINTNWKQKVQWNIHLIERILTSIVTIKWI